MLDGPDISERAGRPGPTKGLWWLTFALFAVLYVATCQRGIGWQDSGMFQWRVLTGDYTGRLGLALAHPLYIAAGRVLWWVSQRHLPLLLNAFSGVGMAVALANLAVVGFMLTGRRCVGLAGAAMVGVAHTPWWLATVAEVYTWSVAGLTAELWLLVSLIRRPRWKALAALALVNGLGLCVHNFALLALPVYAVVAAVLVAQRRLKARSLAAAGIAYLVGAGLYIGMTASLAARTGDVASAVGSALVGRYAAAVVNVADVSKHLRANAALGAMNFVSFLAPLAIVGWARFGRALGRALAAAIGAITLIHVLFVVRYPVPDQFTFLLPTLVLAGLAACVGASELLAGGRRWRVAVIAAIAAAVAVPPAFYAAAPSLMRAADIEARRARTLPFRNEARYWLVPWKHNERSAERFAQAALDQAAPDGVIMPDSTSVHALLLEQKLHRTTPGGTVHFAGEPLGVYGRDPQAFRDAVAGRTLYAVAPLPDRLPAGLYDDATFQPIEGGVLYRVEWKAR